MLKKEIIDETFDIDRSESYILSIQISLKGYSFTVKDTVKDSFILLTSSNFVKELRVDDSWSEAIGLMFSQNTLLGKKFKKVFLTFESPLFTLVPAEFFDPEKSKQLFTLVNDLPELFELHYKEINKIVLLFAIPSSLLTQLKLRQPLAILVGYPMPLINSAQMSIATTGEHFIAVNIANNFIINVIAQGKTLKNCTPYLFHNIDDIAYHLVNSCKQLDLTPANQSLIISGINQDQQDLVQLLSKFFKKVTPDKGFIGDHYSYSIDKFRTQFWNLFNISQCE